MNLEPDAWKWKNASILMDQKDPGMHRKDVVALYSAETILKMLDYKIQSLQGYKAQDIDPEHVLQQLKAEIKGEALE